MRYRPLGQSGIQTSVVAFGAWAIGGWRWGGTDAQASVKAIQAGLDAGINFIDTAAVYGFGLSEELVGQAIKDRPRDQIVLATKCGLRWDIETPKLDSWSARLTWSPRPAWAAQISHGFIKEPEATHPGENEHRTTVSIHYATHRGLRAMAAFSAAIVASRFAPSRGKRMAGLGMRGQGNCGK